ncbi:MAG: hypothetical protein AAB388_04075 [Patescibacteria group bacterium]
MSKTEKPIAPVVAKKASKERSPVGWFIHHTLVSIKSVFKKHPRLTKTMLIVVPLVLLHIRWAYQPFIHGVRIYFGAILTVMVLTGITWFTTRKQTIRVRGTATFVCLLLTSVALARLEPVNRYIASFQQYQTLEIVDLRLLPTTANERVLPLNAVHSLIRERMDESQLRPTVPDLVHTKHGDVWTIAVQPARFVGRMTGSVGEIMSIPATSPSPDFSRTNPIRVRFRTGEEMLFSNNLHSCTLRSFGPWRFLNHEPSNILYMQDDTGEWIQVVSLIKWSGLFFPRPEFGGVQIVRQEGKRPHWTELLRPLIGCGEYVSPRNVSKHTFLRGQNLVAPQVTRFVAESFRFQEGFTGPLPGVHSGDVRIPNLPDDVNPQPFTLHFKMPGEKIGALYAYFALEPFDPEKQGLATSLFIPADGSRLIYQYQHSTRGTKLIGVSTVGPKVEESKKNYDWTRFRPVEHRPFIRKFSNRKGEVTERLFWMTTVVAVKQTESEVGAMEFITGATPEIAITDARTGVVVWVDPLQSKAWPTELQSRLGNTWE